MKRPVIGLLTGMFVLAAVAGFSGAQRIDDKLSQVRHEWAAIQSLPPGDAKVEEMGELRGRTEQLAQRYPENGDVQTWEAVVEKTYRELKRPWADRAS